MSHEAKKKIPINSLMRVGMMSNGCVLTPRLLSVDSVMSHTNSKLPKIHNRYSYYRRAGARLLAPSRGQAGPLFTELDIWNLRKIWFGEFRDTKIYKDTFSSNSGERFTLLLGGVAPRLPLLRAL